MAIRPTREEHFIKRFLSAYEKGSWGNAILEKPDTVDRTNPAVDQIATRKCDGKKLAIEHTIIEPFVGEKEDFAFFQKAFLGIEKDEALLVPGLWIQVFVPVGTLRNRPQRSRDLIVQIGPSLDQIESALSFPWNFRSIFCSVSPGFRVSYRWRSPLASRWCR